LKKVFLMSLVLFGFESAGVWADALRCDCSFYIGNRYIGADRVRCSEKNVVPECVGVRFGPRVYASCSGRLGGGISYAAVTSAVCRFLGVVGNAEVERSDSPQEESDVAIDGPTEYLPGIYESFDDFLDNYYYGAE